MELLAENTRKGYCPKCNSKLGECIKREYEDDYIYFYYECGKCNATQIEEVYSVNLEYKYTNAWKPLETK